MEPTRSERKQYCRYCAYCVSTLDAICWCEKLQKEMGDSSAKRVNRCKKFLFNEIDAFNPEMKYKPRAKKVPNDSPTLFWEEKKMKKVWQYCNELRDAKNRLADKLGMSKVEFDWKECKDTGNCDSLQCCDCPFYGNGRFCNDSELKRVLNMDLDI